MKTFLSSPLKTTTFVVTFVCLSYSAFGKQEDASKDAFATLGDNLTQGFIGGFFRAPGVVAYQCLQDMYGYGCESVVNKVQRGSFKDLDALATSWQQQLENKLAGGVAIKMKDPKKTSTFVKIVRSVAKTSPYDVIRHPYRLFTTSLVLYYKILYTSGTPDPIEKQRFLMLLQSSDFSSFFSVAQLTAVKANLSNKSKEKFNPQQISSEANAYFSLNTGDAGSGDATV